MMDNSNFKFAVESGTSATVGENTGVITATSTAGATVISVTLNGADGQPTDKIGYANVTVKA